MKKILMLFAAAALVLGAASCQKENFQKALAEGQEQIDYSDDPMGVIKVYIKKDDTRMAFEENTSGQLTRAFAEGDSLSGCTKVGDVFESFAYTFEGEGKDDAGDYMLLRKTSGKQGVPSAKEGTVVNFVYAPGAVSFDPGTGACSLNLSNQDEAHIPAVMVASGTVGDADEQGVKLSLKFENIAAVLAIKSPKLKDFDDSADMSGSFNKVSVSAFTKGKLTLGEDGYVTFGDNNYTPNWDGTVESGIATVTGKENFGSDVYVAILPGTYSDNITAKIVDVKDGDDKRLGSFGYKASPNKDIAANAYLRINDKGFVRIPVAEIGTDKYATVDDAVAAANEAGTAEIKILEDCSAPAQTIAAGKNVTLDLNGKTVTAPISVNGTFTVNDGDNTTNSGILQIAESDKITVSVSEGAKFILNGGIVKGCYSKSGQDYSTIKILGATSNKAKLCINGGKVITNSSYGAVYGKDAENEINNCEIIAERTENQEATINVRAFFLTTRSTTKVLNSKITSNTHVFHFGATSASVELNSGCTYKAGVGIFNLNTAAGTIVVNDGYFDTSIEGSSLFIKTENLTNTLLKGGYYTAEPNERSVSSGYEIVTLDEPTQHDGVTYTHKVIQSSDPVAQIGGKTYHTLDAAMDVVNKAKEPVTMKLLQEIDMQKSLAVTNTDVKVTVDLNQHEITFRNASYNISISKNVNVEIKNGSIAQNTNGSSGGIDNYSKAIVNNGGSLSLNNVKITAITSSSYSIAVYQPEGTLVVEGDNSEMVAAKCIQAGKDGGSGSYVTINKGTITSKYSGSGTDSNSGFCISGTYGTEIVVNGGTLKATYTGTTKDAGQVAIYCRYANSTTEIKGGSVTADHNYAVYGNACKSVTVSGGTVQSTGQIGIYANSSTEVTVSDNADISSTTNSGISVNNAKLIVKGGKIYSTASHGIYAYGSATVNISDGEIYSLGESSGRGFYVYTGTTATISGGYIHSNASQAIYTTRNLAGDPKPKLTITGGTFETNAKDVAAIYVYTIDENGASISQAENSKTIVKSDDGPALQVRDNASLSIMNVSGGYFSGKNSSISVASPGKLTISGGYFNSNVSGYVASGKSCTTEGGPWTNGTSDGISYTYIVK